MTGQGHPNLADVFSKLNCWRHLPAYRLESVLTPYFGLFLRDILREAIETEVHPLIIPEFPLRIGTLYPNNVRRPNQSKKVDYVAFSKNLRKTYFIELKTDSQSFDCSQLEYLVEAKKRKFRCILEGIKCICKATKGDYTKKYVHLLHYLSELSFVDSTYNKLHNLAISDSRRGWKKAVECGVKINEPVPEIIEIVYITPTGRELEECKEERLRKEVSEEIGFCQIATLIQSRGELGSMFANYLREWKTPAGAADPRKFRAAP